MEQTGDTELPVKFWFLGHSVNLSSETASAHHDVIGEPVWEGFESIAERVVITRHLRPAGRVTEIFRI